MNHYPLISSPPPPPFFLETLKREREREREREMKASSILIAFSCLTLILFFNQVNSQDATDSCNSTVNAQLPFDVSPFICLSVWDSQNFILRYMQTGSSQWSFVLSTPNPSSYVAMGFSPNGKMIGSSAIVGWANSDGTAIMKRYYLGGQSPGEVQPDQGNLQLGNLSSITTNHSRIFMAFQLDTDRPLSKLIYSVGPANFQPSTSTYRLIEHSYQVSTSLNYISGQSQTKKTLPIASLRRSHGIVNMLAWGILMPIGALVARYMRRWDPIWFYSHVVIQSLAFLLGFAGIVCGFVLETRVGVNVNRHKGLGIVVLILAILQVIALLARPDKGSKMRRYWNWYHHSAGRILILLAAVNVFYGIHLGRAGTSWNASYAVVLVLIFVVGAILELRMWINK